MYRHFDDELRDLKDRILTMGGHVESAVEEATQALLLRQPERFKVVYELEGKINQEHMDVDEACVDLLARQSPLASNLRFIIAILKISTDLERMGDQAVNISYNAKEYLEQSSLEGVEQIGVMARSVRKMVRQSLDAFVQQDRDLAKTVLGDDDLVDGLKDKIFHEMIEQMKKRPDAIEQALNLILIARNLERLGDHATNICEDVIYAVTGKDIRHGNSSAT
jgi:phosphate transport system protein